MQTDTLGRTYPSAEVIVTEPGTYVDRSLPTASARDEYRIMPGVYPITYVDAYGCPWDDDPAQITPGYTANVGPRDAIARVKAIQVGSYYENRLLSEVRASTVAMARPCRVTVRLHPYEIENSRGRVRTVLDRTGVIHLTD